MIGSLAALLFAPPALASPRSDDDDPPAAVAVRPAGVSEAAARAALAHAGRGDAVLVSADDLLRAVDVVGVVALPVDECGAAVALDAWQGRLGGARARIQLLDLERALGDLVALEVETACLVAPVAASDLLRLELTLAEAHHLLAQAAADDAGKRAFHEGEADQALARAAVVGVSLATPAEVDPAVVSAYDAARARLAEERQPLVHVAGPGARVGARFNGRPLSPDPFRAFPGSNLVQAASGPRVAAAVRVRLEPRTRTLFWLAPGQAPYTEADLAADLDALAVAAPAPAVRPRLAAAGRLLGTDVLFVTEGEPSVWAVDRGTLTPLGPEGEGGAVDAWGVALGLGASGGWSDLGLDGLAGPRGGPAGWARVGIAPWTALALTTHPDAVAHPIDEERGGGTLWQATVPVRAGVRFGRRVAAVAPEAGVDVGVHWFGPYEEVRDGVPVVAHRASFLAVGAAGAAVAVGPAAALRVEAWGGLGLGYRVAGGYLGVEWRR